MRKSVSRAVQGAAIAASVGGWLFAERWRPLRRSTIQMAKSAGPGGLRHPLKALHGYVYGRWTNQYIAFLVHQFWPRGGPRASKWLADHYHGKVLTLDQAEAIVMLDHDLARRDLEQVIPYPMARDIVLKGPPDVAVYECGCRHARANPCQPTQVCMTIGQPFVDFVVEHNPQSARRISQAEALDLLRAEHERGHLHSAWFKDACLDRFYAICNCCKCCCGGIEAMVKYGAPMLASSGYVVQTDASRCEGCEKCVTACPFGALSLVEGVSHVEWAKCMGCGVCVGQCKHEALSLVRDEAKGIPLDVRAMA